ncbi:MAG: atpC [Parcubacteria group bacterium]|nr:atpC [Parcubacteria group bacterium]
MAKTFHLTVAKIGENLFDGEATSVTLPGSEGRFQVLASHEAMVSSLVKGTISITGADDAKQEIEIEDGGVAEISNNQATILL